MSSRNSLQFATLELKYRRLKFIAIGLALVAVFLGIVVAAQSSASGNATPGAAPAATGDAGSGQRAAIVRGETDDPRAIGDIDAPVTLVEWTDLRCPYCAVFTRDTMPQVIKEYVDAGKVRIEMNDVAFFGDESTRASVAVRAAGRQGMYFEYLHAVHAVAPEKAKPDLPRDRLIDFAKQIEIPDLAQFTADLDDPVLEQEVLSDTQFAQQVGIGSVPSFVIDGKLLSGAQPIENFRQFIDDALAGK